jgi:4'-phosphopantetheinyl transferase EntD
MLFFDEARIAAELSEALGLPLLARVRREGVAAGRLSAAERRIVAAFGAASRREDWLRGRHALKDLLAELALPEDTSALRLPHARVSLTHSGGVAIAIGTPTEAVSGIGVDLEIAREPREGTEKFFLAARERRWLDACPLDARPRERLRLWTLKEALFKADPGNADRRYGDYELADPAAHRGACGPARYACFVTESGFLSAAARLRGSGRR